ncbi:MAG: DNA primase [Bacteroidota bacterium]
MRIPETKIDEVRTAANIVDVISGYVRLKKRGKSYLGLCPFHQEKTPSFTVSAEKQMYHCFGCGKGGNVFTFVMELEKVSFIEAVRTLAEKAGIALPTERPEDQVAATENEALYNACKVAGLHFHHNMMNTVEGNLALEYFRHRGFSDETIRKFGLGYSMNSWDDLLKHGQSNGVALEMLEKAGLVIRREDGSGLYDRFRGRAMFPIFSASGRPIGFGARKMREEDPVPGKYINSPETPIYIKSQNLFGLFHAKESIRDKEYAILVEGYADLISVFQSGMENIVASSGTALTEEQIKLIGRYAKAVTLVYDADSAGSKATLRGVDLIIEQGLDVKVAELPAGDDPDSFVKKNGGEAFSKLLDGAVSFLDFKVKTFQAQGLLSTPEAQANSVRSIVETIAKMKDELKRNFYIKSVAEKYDIRENVLFRELEKMLGKAESGKWRAGIGMRSSEFGRRNSESGERNAESGIRRAESREENAESGDGRAGGGASNQKTKTELPIAQRDLLKLMLEHGNGMVNAVFSHISPEVFGDGVPGVLVQRMMSHAQSEDEWDGNSLIDEMEDEATRSFIADLVLAKYQISKGLTEEVENEIDPQIIVDVCVAILRIDEIDQIRNTNQKLLGMRTDGDGIKQIMQLNEQLWREKTTLAKKLEELRRSIRLGATRQMGEE